MAYQEEKIIANWTIMVYIAADDMLANFAVGSLKQLKSLASQDANVVVAAQFDANGRRNIPRLIFKGAGDKSESIQANRKDEIASTANMADFFALSSFINWAYAQCRAKHYCLFLWGHGPELLVDDYPVLATGKKVKKFLTPSDLRKALAATDLHRDGHKFDIVGIDACCMSMMEVACELPDHAEFLVASQEEVPDFSFPYDNLLVFGKDENGDEIARACQEIPKRYVDAYQDYILTRETKIAGITLSSLSLKEVGAVLNPLDRLAAALMASIHDESIRRAVIDARANSRAFVAGLYVDLYNFCWELCSSLSSQDNPDGDLLAASKEICAAIEFRGDNAFIIANESQLDRNCHGVSIYFPYLTAAETAKMESPPGPLEKGGTNALKNGGVNGLASGGMDVREKGGMEFLTKDGMLPRDKGGLEFLTDSRRVVHEKGGMDVLSKLDKGGMDVLSKGGMDVLSKLRRQRIEETEQYYAGLELSKKTHWDKFIRHGWSRWLAEEAETGAKPSPAMDMSAVLDQRYSAQQCAINLLSLCRELEKDKNSGYPRGLKPDMPPHEGTEHSDRSN
ncbi:MAG TPA: clostripain-related cysteine peptidase [Candidatus Dormibacteraeota bacterium]|jgi:hypothetical protein|nr:clostripain-related cysteine peptidase [Candidatus Dormibacteraeota bacterium]